MIERFGLGEVKSILIRFGCQPSFGLCGAGTLGGARESAKQNTAAAPIRVELLSFSPNPK
jgi:hypothetical protein